MSGTRAIPHPSETPAHMLSEERVKRRLPSIKSLASYALLGAAAAFFLSVIEWIDLSIQLTPFFGSVGERVAFSAYFSLNILVGSVIGLIVGCFVIAGTFLTSATEKLMARNGKVRLAHRIVAIACICLLAALLLYQQPHVFGYTLGLIREAEKITLTSLLLRLERPLTFLLITLLLAACYGLWKVTRATGSARPWVRYVWMAALLAGIIAAYAVDSRVEVQQYENSLHKSMFLLALALSFALAASLSASSPSLRRLLTRLPPIASASLALLLASTLAFTFARFDDNHALKSLLFYRTTQAKQHFKLATWALDFDRDGYSRLLGGGDSDDARGDINPGEAEVIGDGVDNNCVGGDLTGEAVAEWGRQRDSLRAPANPAAPRFNVIYIFIDTLRADHLSAYGYERDTSPNLDKLASRSSLFENAFTPSPSTFEALPKFMQSSHWDAHLETWTEALARNGYNTILFPGRRDTALPRRLKDATIVNQGKSGNTKETVDAVIELLSNTPTDRPFCAYLYSFEPHMPYKKRDDFYFGPSLGDLYDGEIAYTDFHYGRLFDWMEQTGRMKDTIIVIMSDHGESLGERGVYKHTSQLYNEQMRVPMIFYVPGLAPRRISDYVSTIDLGTSILNAVGLEAPEGYAGTGLLPLMRGERFVRPPVYGEHIHRNESPHVGPDQALDTESRKYMVITQDGYKLIYNQSFYSFELYDLKADPKELRNLFDLMPEKATEMQQLLGRFIDIVVVSRPWDADERKYFMGGDKEDFEQD